MTKESFRLPSAFCAPAELAHLPPDTPVLLALSGGADSRALLHMLATLSREQGFPLTVAHVDHGIRGEEARRDRDFCVSLAARYGFEICVLEADVPALARAGGRGLEEEARAVRYEYFDRLMRERRIPLLATAHHADDQAETVLFRLCRGTGLGGLAGIAPVREFSCGSLTRPLLRMSRKEILDFCTANGLDYVTDSTNADTAYARNRIRADVLPVLDALYPGAAKRITATADLLREDEKLLSSLAEQLLRDSTAEAGLDVAVLRNASVSLCKRALAKWVKQGTGCEAERVHLEALMLLLAAETSCEAALPGDWVAVREFGLLRLYQKGKSETAPFCLPFRCGETLVLPSGIRVCTEKNGKLTKVNNLSTHSYLNLNAVSDIIEKEFFWRSRKDGDVLLMRGMHRRLRRLYREAGIPPRWRDAMPLLCDREGIVWAPFVGLRDGLPCAGETYLLRVELPTEPQKV
ncbi:MAG: tRNA lysidine(34) synthetase TilS [Clostridia bacterium]|nr:tRNA lysidine(34) synthetase TilS [Clostridia bacterium]